MATLTQAGVQNLFTAPYGNFMMNDYTLSINKMFLLTCAIMIFSMQIGFAFLEAGSVRKKNSHIVFFKVMLHSLVVVLSFWVIGFALAFGDSYINYIGGKFFYAGDRFQYAETNTMETTQWANWVVQYSIAAVVVAINNGAISERTTLLASCIHAFYLTLFVYPVVLAWTWGGGWLTWMGYVDFSGSGVVHTTGAFAALAGMLIVGPRYNKFKKFEDVCDMRTPEERAKQEKELKTEFPIVQGLVSHNGPKEADHEVHNEDYRQRITYKKVYNHRLRIAEEDYETALESNLIYSIMGALWLWVGFVFYNAGSTLGLLKNFGNQNPLELWRQAELAAVNTYISGCAAGLLVLLVKAPLMHWRQPNSGWPKPLVRRFRDEAGGVTNGFLAGMVACGAGMNDYEPWAAFVTGLFGGFFYLMFCKLLDVVELDDAVEAFPLHGGGGMAGVHCAAFLTRSKGIVYGWPGRIFGVQILGWVMIAVWSFLMSLIGYYILHKFKILRTDLKTEIVGYDFIEFADDYELQSNELVYRDKSAPAAQAQGFQQVGPNSPTAQTQA